jgi:phytoene desaturase
LYSVITYMDCIAGVYFPEGGMHAVPRALAAAAVAHGVTIRYGTTVSRIEISGPRASAVITHTGERIAADVVLVNADLPAAAHELLPPGYAPRRFSRLRYSPSAVVLNVGSAADYEDAVHHTIEFGAAWDETFAQIIDRGQLMSDPSFLLTNATRTDDSLAPPNRHTYCALFPAPNLVSGRVDWEMSRDAYRDHIVDTIEKRGYEGFADGIECMHLTTPADWAAQGIAAGAPFSASHRFSQTGPFRPATLDRRIENLVYAGANTQPGVGVPMVLLSGQLAAQRVTG